MGIGFILKTLEHKLFLNDDVVNFALDLEKELEVQKGKKLPLNIDGMVGALLNYLEIDKDIAPAIFIIARTSGLAKIIINK